MREIKFRVWGLVFDDFAMLPVSQLSWDEHDDGVVRLHFCGSLDKKLQGSFGVHCGFGNVNGSEDTGWVLMQYTGLKDKNGREIYERDILSFGKRSHTKLPCLYKVYWNDDNASFDIWDLRHNTWGGQVASCGEVIGNIYENPELLEAK